MSETCLYDEWTKKKSNKLDQYNQKHQKTQKFFVSKFLKNLMKMHMHVI